MYCYQKLGNNDASAINNYLITGDIPYHMFLSPAIFIQLDLMERESNHGLPVGIILLIRQKVHFSWTVFKGVWKSCSCEVIKALRDFHATQVNVITVSSCWATPSAEKPRAVSWQITRKNHGICVIVIRTFIFHMFIHSLWEILHKSMQTLQYLIQFKPILVIPCLNSVNIISQGDFIIKFSSSTRHL